VVIPGLYASENLQDSVWHWTVETELLPKNKSGGYDYEYSDLGFYLLQRLIEKISGTRIDSLADSVLYHPMGMATMTYLPLCKFPRDRIVPTEKDTYFRHKNIIFHLKIKFKLYKSPFIQCQYNKA
jgi:hypothetical protein